MDFNKKIGKNKELIEKEHQARRNYNQKWGNLLQGQPHSLYNPYELNQQLQQQLPEQTLNFYNYTGHGDSYFVSREMYETLLAKCRCGRKRNCAHVLKCLQKEKDKYAAVGVESVDMAANDEEKKQKNGSTGEFQISSKDVEKINEHLPNDKQKSEQKMFATTNEIIGWRPAQSRYNQWEKSMKYVSPVLTMAGHRITAIPYNAIIIG